MFSALRGGVVAFLSLAYLDATCGQVADEPLRAAQLRGDDPVARERAVKSLHEKLRSDPRGTVTEIMRNRWVDDLTDVGQFELAAELALRCVNAEPGRMDRLEYFMGRRVRALLAAGRGTEALAAAKSHFNIVSVEASSRAIDLLRQALDLAHPDRPELARRFMLQQLAGASHPSPATTDLGQPVFQSIKVEASAYADDSMLVEVNPEWRLFAVGNLELLQDRPREAVEIFRRLLTARHPRVREAAQEGLARAAKAVSGRIGDANAILLESHGNAGR